MKIGKYEVVRQIAKGDLATVFEAVEPSPPYGLGRKIALKLVTTTDKDLRRRFAREAEMTARLGEHPNITNAYDMGFHDEAPFLVEEYLSGEDLRQKIERQEPLSLEEKLGFLLGIAKGLRFSHAKDIVHRDIKPENIRVLKSGQVKIMDFGIGKVVSSEATRLSLKGALMGTIGYLAPEQLFGESDARTDIFAYGVVAYELLTYRHPFAAGSLREHFQILQDREPTPITEFFTECPRELARLTHKCLEKSPEKRPQSFDEITSELRVLLREGGQPTAAMSEDPAFMGTVILNPEALARLADLPALSRPEGDAPTPQEKSTAGEPGVTAEDQTAASATREAVASEPATAPEPRPEQGAVGATDLPPVPAEGFADIVGPSGDGKETSVLAQSKVRPLLDSAVAGVSAAGSFVTRTAASLGSKLGALRLPETPALERIPKALLILGPALVVAILVLVWVVRREPAVETPAEHASAEATPTSAVSGPVPGPVLGTAVIDAFPWGEVQRIVDEFGAEIPAPTSCITPCSLELAPGRYQLYLVNSEIGGPEQLCEIVVAEGSRSACRVEFSSMTTLEYFKGTGWWG